MNITFFMVNLAITLALVLTAILYLRNATRSVIRELCHTDAAAEYWLRSADILAIAGSLMLVLVFGDFDPEHWIHSIRLTVILTLLGLFIAVMIVTKKVWKRVDKVLALEANQ
jgi:hypothetical protein